MKVLKKKSKEVKNLRRRGRPKKRVLLEGLERETTQERSNAIDGVLGAVVDVHGDDEHDCIGDNKQRDKPGDPFLEMLDFPEWAWCG